MLKNVINKYHNSIETHAHRRNGKNVIKRIAGLALALHALLRRVQKEPVHDVQEGRLHRVQALKVLP